MGPDAGVHPEASGFDRRAITGYAAAAGAVALATLVRWALRAWLESLGVFVLYYPVVMAVAIYAGFGPGLLATVLSGLAIALLFLASPPSSAELFLLVVFVLTGTALSVFSELLTRSRRQAALALHRQRLADAQLALQASEARAAAVLQTAVDGIITIDERGIVDSANPAAERLFGYAADEMIGRNVSMLMPTPYREQHDTYIANYIRTGQRKIIGIGREVVGLRKDGSTFPMDLAVSEMRVGGRRMFTGLVHDLTERKRFEDELRLAKDAAEAARREADNASRMKDEFLATLSHELRTPLNAMLGWARLLRMGGLDEPTTEQAIGAIERNAQAQAQLVEDLLDVSRIISGKLRLDLRPVDFGQIVEAAISSMQPAADAKRIRIERHFDPGVPALLADPGRLQQVVWNLLSNAIKFTPQGGHVRLAIRFENSHAELRVTDNGRGIEPQFLPHVFDRFSQADGSSTRVHSGLGLGLAIVRHIVEMHGGTAEAHSDGLGRGAMFLVRLPAAAPGPEPSSAGHAPT